jgi:hypothetical protein
VEINPNSFVDASEADINICDIDIVVKTWANTISSALLFLRQVLVFPELNYLSKFQENVSLIALRVSVVSLFFDMIMRVERKIKKTVNFCIQSLIKQEHQAKDILPNEEKFKQILKPILACLQLSFDKFTPQFLHMFKSLLKLISVMFNRQLSDKLIDHLQYFEKAQNISQISPYQQKTISNLLFLFQHFCYLYNQPTSQLLSF